MNLFPLYSTDRKHLHSPSGDVRSRAVLCAGFLCGRQAWNVCGYCDACCPHDQPALLVTSPGSDAAPVLLGPGRRHG
jgi:hypothetical protein